jgi:prepilin-type N-terminal cleavage/methylation domain-containing protein
MTPTAPRYASLPAADRHRRRPAFSLLETTVVLTVVAIALAIVAPRFTALRDASAVRGAMAEVGGQFSLARQTAMARRSATSVVFDTGTGVIEVRSGGVRVARRQLRDVYGIVLSSNRDSAVYDARGLGYGVTNLTVTVHRGRFVDTLTMSRLGRTKW